MSSIPDADPRAVALIEAIRSGDEAGIIGTGPVRSDEAIM